MPIPSFLLRNARLLSFGLLLAFVSSFGQTYFISLFGDELRSTFALSHGDLGSIYAVATVSSGAVLVWAGRRIDDVDLRLYTVLACGVLATACVLAWWAPTVATLALALFALRFGGQGLLSHTAAVTMARYFERDRGKAIGIGSLGYPAGEVVLPLLCVAAIAAIGWRSVWLWAAGVVVLATPLLLWLLRGHGERHRRLMAQEPSAAAGGSAAPPRIGVLRLLLDRPFLWRIPAVLMPSLIVTGLIFHQAHIAALKGWSLAWIASAFIAYAVTKAMVAVAAGSLVDRMSAKRALPLSILPLGVTPMLLLPSDDPLGAIAYFAMMGVTSGASGTAATAVWAEVYGQRQLGTVRAVASALAVVASGLGPAAFGAMFDAGLGLGAIAASCAVAVVFTAALARAA